MMQRNSVKKKMMSKRRRGVGSILPSLTLSNTKANLLLCTI